MAIKMLRGTVTNLTKPDRYGTADCQIDGCKIRISRDLDKLMREGDDVLVAGIQRNDVLHPMAVKNFRLGRTARVDSANYVLLMGLGGFLGVLCGVFGLQAIDSGEVLIEWMNDIISIIGFIGMALATRHVIQINRASNLVTYPGS